MTKSFEVRRSELRRVMVRPDREKLGGIVEVDETCIGGERQANVVAALKIKHL